jgi:6-phospho-beta-glucosidase
MKLALIGGGGVRAPEFVKGLLLFARDLDLQELWLMDVDPERLDIIGELCRQLITSSSKTLSVFTTLNLDDALRNANIIVTTMRVGFEQGRVLDERVALRHNVLGQETTGAGGFSMAMRSIPALLEAAEKTEALAPGAWTFNFTNPAGLVTQALHTAGFRRIVGICDSANTAQHEIAYYLGCPVDTVKTEVYGLNHLSWTRCAYLHGRDVLPELLHNDQFLHDTHLRIFDERLVRRLGMFLNEYLFYYYCRDVALERIKAEELTRGEEIQQLNQQLFATLRTATDKLGEYDRYNARRNATYMAYAQPDNIIEKTALHTQETVGGYAGVALRTALALFKDRPLRIGLNVPNQGAIDGLAADDIVEVTCTVDGSGIHPIYIGEIPEDTYLLIRAVKRYERLAVQAILSKNRMLAIDALFAHPLIGSYPLAEKLVDAYLEVHHLQGWL